MPPKRATGSMPDGVVEAVTTFLHQSIPVRGAARKLARRMETEFGVKRARLRNYIKDRQARNPRLNATEDDVCEAAAELRRDSAMMGRHTPIRDHAIAEALQDHTGSSKFRTTSRVQNTMKKHRDLRDTTRDPDFGDMATTSQRLTDLQHHNRV